MQSTFPLVVLGLFVAGPAWADTYERTDGETVPIVTLEGQDHPYDGNDLKPNAILGGAELSEANLPEANLQGARLGSANLGRANLAGANLSGARLMQAWILHANLRGANLSRTNLAGANLAGSDLRDANLSGANLTGTFLGKIDRKNARTANLSGAYYVRGSEPRWPQGFDPKAAGVLVKERPKP
jgi:uncharacterized protein YjbI with pentapeptide repeats